MLGSTGALTRNCCGQRGYLFVGWNTAANGSGESYKSGSMFTMGSVDVTLYPMWALPPTYVSAGLRHVLAVKNDGTLWAWGSGTSGQLGLGDDNYRAHPVQVGDDSNWIGVQNGVGDQIGFATKDDGTLWAWGRNDKGQLGQGDFTERHAPTQVW